MKQINLLKEKTKELLQNKSENYVKVFFDFLEETRKYFKKQSFFYINSLSKYPELKKSADEDFLKKIKPLFEKIFKLWKEEELKRLNQNLEKYWYFDYIKKDDIFLNNLEAVKYAEQRAWEFIDWINETTQKQVSAIISTWIRESKDITTIASEINNVFLNYGLYRATLIAQQETAMAYSAATRKMVDSFAEDLWVDGWKRAITQKDSNVRDSHRENEAEWRIPKKQVFWTGHDNVPFGYFCRCDVSYSLVNPETWKLYENEEIDFWGGYTDEQVERFTNSFHNLEDYNYKILKKEKNFIKTKNITDQELIMLKEYTNEYYTILNDYFKRWINTEEFKSSIKFMFWWFRKLDNYYWITYRWHKVSNKKELEEILSLKSWDIYKTKSFFSSSKSKIKSIDFTDENNIIFKILSNKWKDIEKVSTKKEEKEVLFAPDSLFKIENIKNDWKFTIIEITDLKL